METKPFNSSDLNFGKYSGSWTQPNLEIVSCKINLSLCIYTHTYVFIYTQESRMDMHLHMYKYM